MSIQARNLAVLTTMWRLGVCATLLGGVGLSTASACDMAEKLRLAEEEKKLAARNAWAGVERAYEALLATKCELDYDQHYLGSESARVLGKTYEQYERLQRSLTFGDNPQLQEAMAAIDENYGRIDIQGDPRRRPTLTRDDMPFAPDQRKSVEYAQTVVLNTGSFFGMLPAGNYKVGELDVVVVAGSKDVQVVQVGKVKGPRPAPVVGSNVDGGDGGDVSAIRYANLVATIGPNVIATSVGKINTLADGGDQFVPEGLTASGFAAQIGGEFGLSYAEPARSVAAVAGYSGGYGSDTFHNVSLWVAGVLRPGEFRIAVGPQYAVLIGKGTGIAEEVSRGESVNNANVQYAGLAWGPGAQASVGYGLLDFDKLRGVVELGGAWQSDGARSYYGVGLRVGVVPTVPRFKG